jgi:hypothetical protein
VLVAEAPAGPVRVVVQALALVLARVAVVQALVAATDQRRQVAKVHHRCTPVQKSKSILKCDRGEGSPACAVEAFADARGISRGLLAGAILLGLLFIGLKGLEYAEEYREHLVPGIDFAFDGPLADGVELFFVFYFVATTLHALHMLVGIGLLATFALLMRRAGDSRTRAALHSAALYWHFVDVVWIFLFALIYLPGRSS